MYDCSETKIPHRLKHHYSAYEPTLRQLKQKYETAMKEKMLTKLERDRAVGQVVGLQSTLKNMENFRGTSASKSTAVCTHLENREKFRENILVKRSGKFKIKCQHQGKSGESKNVLTNV